MNKTLRKLISFVLACVSIADASVIGADSAFMAEKISDSDFDSFVQMQDKNIYIEKGDMYSVEEGSKIVVIGNDGEKKIITLKEGINGIYNYIATKTGDYIYSEVTGIYSTDISAVYDTSDIGVYNYLSQSSSYYSFDFLDSNYRLSTEEGAIIVGTGDNYALMNTDGEIVSDEYLSIFRISNGFYETVSVNDDRFRFGVIDSEGKTIIEPSEEIRVVYLTSDGNNFLVDGVNEDYFTDLEGNVISDKYAQIDGIKKDADGISGWSGEGNYAAEVDEDGNYGELYKYYVGCRAGYVLSDKIYVFTDSEGNKAAAFNSMSPETGYYEKIEQSSFDEGFLFFREDENKQVFDYYDHDGNIIFDSCDNIGVLNISYNSIGEHDAVYYMVSKEKKMYLYDAEKKLKLENDMIYMSEQAIDSAFSYNLTENDCCFFCYENNRLKMYNVLCEPLENGDFQEPAGKFCGSTICNGDRVYHLYKNNGKYTIYNYDYSKSAELNLNTKHEGNTIVYAELDNPSYSDRIYVKTGEFSSGNGKNELIDETYSFCINDDMQIFDTNSYYSAEQKGDYVLCCENYTYKRAVYDFSGKMVLELKEGQNFSSSDGVYYLSENGSFIILGSNLNEITDKINGEIKNEYSYCYYDEKSDKETYGVINSKDGKVTDSIYNSVIRFDEISPSWNHKECGCPLDSLIAVRDGAIDIYDSERKLVREIKTGLEGTVSFGSAEADSDILYVNAKNSNTGKTTTIIYDMLNEELIYSQIGEYESVSCVKEGYAVVTVLNDGIYGQGLIKADGTEVIPPLNGLSIDMKLGCYRIDSEIGVFYSADKGEAEYYPNGTATKEKNDYIGLNGLYTEMNNLDFVFADKNGYSLAVKIKNGNYIVFKDSKWGICKSDGTVLIEPKYDALRDVTDNLMVTVNGEADENGLMTEYVGIIDSEGNTVVEPFAENKTNFGGAGSIMYADGVYHIRKNSGITSTGYIYQDLKISDRYNEFTAEYGYDTAVKCEGVYIVRKNGLYGVVTSNNDVIIPIEYADVLRFVSNNYTLASNTEINDILASDRYCSPIYKLDDGTGLISLRKQNGKICAFRISNDVEIADNLGDMNGDGVIDASDASDVLHIYALLSTGGEDKVSEDSLIIADVNRDGNADASDASAILGYYAYLSTQGGNMTITEYINS